MNFLEKFFEEVAGTLLILVATVYISGFIIVNAYLLRYHIAEIEIFEPAFIASGLFFCIAIGITVILVWPIAMLLTGAFATYDIWAQSGPLAASSAVPSNQPNAQNNFFRNMGLLTTLLVVVAILIFFSYLVEVGFIKWFVIQIIFWASASLNTADLEIIDLTLGKIIKAEGLLAIPIFLIIQNWRRLEVVLRDFAVSLCVLMFIFVQAYSLLVFAENVYPFLPSNIGGGQPVYVRFYVVPDVAKQLDALDNTFPSHTEAIISTQKNPCKPVAAGEKDLCLVPTNKLTLFWQIHTKNTNSNTTEDVYYVRPTECDDCPIVKIYGSTIFSVAYDQPPGN